MSSSKEKLVAKQVIQDIKKNNTIVKYLEDRNIHPQKKYADKYSYLSPLYEGDIDPSFYVFFNEDKLESWWCFGSSKGGDIFELRKILEKKSFKDIISSYDEFEIIKDYDLSEKDIIKAIIDSVSIYVEKEQSMDEIMMHLSIFCYNHMKFFNFNETESKVVEQIYKKIDDLFYAKKYKIIRESWMLILDKLNKRKRDYVRQMRK